MKFYYDGERLLNEEEFQNESAKFINENMERFVSEEDIEYHTQLALNKNYTVYGILKLNLTREEGNKLLEEYKMKAIIKLKEDYFKEFADYFTVFDINFETKAGKVLSRDCLE